MRPHPGYPRAPFLALLLTLSLTASARAVFDVIRETGPSSNRIDVFFLGDGYTATDIANGTYNNHVQSYVNYMFANNVNSDPFYRYRNFFNLYRINVVSAQSGADEPQNGVTKNTALDASYRHDGTTDRLLYINNAKANTILNAAIAGSGKTAEMKFVTVNDAIYGGGGGSYAVYAGGNASAREIALHENAHSFDNLADEYGGGGAYSGREPSEINVTKDPSGAKWARWIGYKDPTGSVVGAYAGGRYFDSGIYRPTADSKMRSLGVPFNAIAREQIILDIYAKVRPLDSYTPNIGTITDPTSLSVTRIDDSVINMQWLIDGTLDLAADNLSTFSFSSLNLSPGNHTIGARAYDPTAFDPINGWVRMNANLLQQSVNWSISITPEPATLLPLTTFFFLALTRRRRTPVL